jgi:hypothetical protein
MRVVTQVALTGMRVVTQDFGRKSKFQHEAPLPSASPTTRMWRLFLRVSCEPVTSVCEYHVNLWRLFTSIIWTCDVCLRVSSEPVTSVYEYQLNLWRLFTSIIWTCDVCLRVSSEPVTSVYEYHVNPWRLFTSMMWTCVTLHVQYQDSKNDSETKERQNDFQNKCERHLNPKQKQPGLLSPQFKATSSHVFTRSPQNVAVEPGIHSLVC